MRPKERIPIFLKLLNWDDLEKRWDLDIPQTLRGVIFTSKVIDYWNENYDQRFGQVLINLGLLPDSINIWMDEENEILLNQGCKPRDVYFWGSRFDKNMNQLPETKYVLIKDMTTDHIQAIIDGNWSMCYMKELFKEELIYRKES